MDDDARIEPLRIAASGYASATAALGDPEVPEDGLPVAAAGGDPAKASFVRLVGTDTVLALALVDDGGAHRFPDAAVVAACPITEEWQPVRGQTMSEAPAYDCMAAVDATRVDDSTFTFELSSFGDPAAGLGFALVPGSKAAAFQVTFSVDAVEARPHRGES